MENGLEIDYQDTPLPYGNVTLTELTNGTKFLITIVYFYVTTFIQSSQLAKK